MSPLIRDQSMPPSSSSNNDDVISNGVSYAARPPTAVVAGDVAGKVTSGMLHKWVNCGKGWRPRWFVLQDGVVSYYKIVVTEKGRLVAGKVSHLHRKPLGEIHLKVSSIQECRSDDRRFSIFTGTKKIHLKAKTQEDQMAWMEALHAMKRMCPRISNSELMTPVNGITISTEKLRQRLLEEGVSEATIQESERIVRSEYSAMQDQLVLFRKKLWLLIDKLRML